MSIFVYKTKNVELNSWCGQIHKICEVSHKKKIYIKQGVKYPICPPKILGHDMYLSKFARGR